MSEELDGLEPLQSVLNRDERWCALGNRSLEQHHTLIAQYSLHAGVPEQVAQQYENARNTWLYAFFSYRLLQVALMQVHVAGEAAIKARAKAEGVDTAKTSLKVLMDMALDRRWLLDTNFEVTARRAEREAEQLKNLRFMGVDRSPFVGPLHEQDYAKRLVDAFRHIRNSLAHGEVLLDPNLGWAFLAVRDLINQLFPLPTT
ncbi:hypothetical protein [Rhodoferax sp.]|uniref:hypothetical protein n=1 Tax=Rhodoferax sp. TaxID=50421 RepID=UPI002ACD74BF|nr:hypothetical protein [Rhodoferax sp.]MDZ7919355.1 hypothetical protein [Rhodoferax sp.]